MNSPELIAHIMKGGGRILVVGGETKDLPRQFHEHAQILIWDDNQQNLLNREVPTNVKVIMFSRWISHTMAARLHKAAKQLNALKFPMLRPREIRELLAEVAQTPEPPSSAPLEVIERQIEQINQNNTPAFPSYVEEPEVKETTVAKKQLGFLSAFISKHLDITKDYSVKGSKSKEADRLWEIAQKEKVPTTKASLYNGTAMIIRGLGKDNKVKGIAKYAARTKPVDTSATDDFQELERLIVDAIAAMKLVQEHLPKVRKETEKLRGMKAKFLKLLE